MKKALHKVIGISPVSIKASKIIYHALNYFLINLILRKVTIKDLFGLLYVPFLKPGKKEIWYLIFHSFVSAGALCLTAWHERRLFVYKILHCKG